MIVKADLAHEKACPMYNQPCQGDKCMAWRWQHVYYPTPSRLLKAVKTDSGYCGMTPAPPIGADQGK